MCVWRGMGGQTFKTKSSGSKLCGPVAKEPFEEEAVRGESSRDELGAPGRLSPPLCSWASIRVAVGMVRGWWSGAGHGGVQGNGEVWGAGRVRRTPGLKSWATRSKNLLFTKWEAWRKACQGLQV